MQHISEMRQAMNSPAARVVGNDDAAMAANVGFAGQLAEHANCPANVPTTPSARTRQQWSGNRLRPGVRKGGEPPAHDADVGGQTISLGLHIRQLAPQGALRTQCDGPRPS